ncbi:MAG: dihydroorotate dehydrogenase-like protein [Porticoccaceae bacterium]|nr:dihydroorotate dehydrogenase-like protein [Porticoccaceae bacterium]
MIDLRTSYLGLALANPLVASSSPLTGNVDMAKRLEDEGAAAIVMPSLFEESLQADQEQIHRLLDFQDIGTGEADSFLPEPVQYQSHLDEYLEKVVQLKQSLSIPVIGSLNGISATGWLDYARDIEQAGCDALELNVYYVAADLRQSGAEVENRYIEVLEKVRAHTALPIGVKISTHFSSVGHVISRLQQNGADGVSLFNRFYQPDIDLEGLQVKPVVYLSSSSESLERIRWLALLYGQVGVDLAATGGFHRAEDVIKAILAGADAVCLCSVLLKQGVGALGTILRDMQDWMEEREYVSIEQMKGSVCQHHAINPVAYEHANYLAVLDSWLIAEVD